MIEQSIFQYQEKMVSGEETALKLTEWHLNRIEEISASGPAVNAVIELNPEALEIAASLDKERTQGKIRGPLHGIPVMLKDIIETADKMHTTAGSLALKNHIAKEDSFIVKKLRDAGAIILGKNTLSEWGNFRSTKSVSGWSSRGGQVKNPYALNRNPCGSSSGTGVAVSANLCVVGVGGETDGSIVCPAQANGVVGLKPTLGLISRSGLIPIAHSQDTAGPIARTVTDAAILLGVMSGEDKKDIATATSVGKYFTDYTQFLNIDGLKGARIGIARNFFGFNKDVDQVIENCIEVLKAQGAEIIDDANIDHVEEYRESELTVLLYEFKNDLNAYLATLNENIPVHSLKDIIDFNNQNKDHMMLYFGQELFEMAEEKGGLAELDYIEALTLNHKFSRNKGIDATMTKFKLDAIVAPAGGPAWRTDYEKGDVYIGGSSSPAAVAGYPNITVPAGYINQLPIGISFMSTAYQEPTLLKLAYAFEQASLVRKPPTFLETI